MGEPIGSEDVTEQKFLKNIKKTGLLPRNQGERTQHPKRIYLIYDVMSLRGINNFKSDGYSDLMILKIDPSKTSGNNFYLDPMSDGIYTNTKIPASAIVGVIPADYSKFV